MERAHQKGYKEVKPTKEPVVLQQKSKIHRTHYLSTTHCRLPDYSSIVWNPYLQKDIQNVEVIQRRAARFSMNNDYGRKSSVTNMLDELKWDTLQNRRKQHRLTMMYNIDTKVVGIDTSEIPTHSTGKPHQRGSHTRQLQVPACETTHTVILTLVPPPHIYLD